MKRCVVVLVTLGVLTAVSTADEKAKAIEQEQKKLKGRWKQVSVEMEGKERAVPDMLAVIVTIDGDKWVSETPTRKTESTFVVDPTQNPKAFDWVRKATDEKGKDIVEKCIYKLDKDTLIICTARTGLGTEGDAPGRPKEFKTTEGGTIFTYKRMDE
jgi:uncharacterized protein (TIGR03067 family)